MVEHPAAQVGFHLDGGAEEADAPEEPAHHHHQDGQDQGKTDLVQQEIHIEGVPHAAGFHETGVHAVDDHSIEFRD